MVESIGWVESTVLALAADPDRLRLVDDCLKLVKRRGAAFVTIQQVIPLHTRVTSGRERRQVNLLRVVIQIMLAYQCGHPLQANPPVPLLGRNDPFEILV